MIPALDGENHTASLFAHSLVCVMSLTRLSTACTAFRLLSLRPAICEASVSVHSSAACSLPEKPRDRRDLIRNVPRKTEGVDGQDAIDVDVRRGAEKCYRLPDENTPNELFNGIPFSETHVCHIKCSKNNTIMTLTDGKCKEVLIVRSCGTEGFKNCRKGTTVAAQTTGLAMATRMHKAGITSIRVCVKGLGPGRMEAVKGLLVGGISIISISDVTPYYDFPCRPPAAKSL